MPAVLNFSFELSPFLSLLLELQSENLGFLLAGVGGLRITLSFCHYIANVDVLLDSAGPLTFMAFETDILQGSIQTSDLVPEFPILVLRNHEPLLDFPVDFELIKQLLLSPF